MAGVRESCSDLGSARSTHTRHRNLQQRFEPRGKWGWKAPFVVTGAIGFLWVAAFQLFCKAHPQMEAPTGSKASASSRVKWASLLRCRQTWAVFFCRFFADLLWYFFVFWIPEFLSRERGLNLAGIGLVAWIPS